MKKIMMTILLSLVMFLTAGCNVSDNDKALQVKTQEEAVDFFMGLLKGWDYIKIESLESTAYCKSSENIWFVEYFDTEGETGTNPFDVAYLSKEVHFQHTIENGTDLYLFKYQPSQIIVSDIEEILIEIEKELTDAKFTKDGLNLKLTFNMAIDPDVEGSYEYTGDSKIYFSIGDRQSKVFAPSSSTVFEDKRNGLLADFQENKITSVNEAKDDIENRVKVFESSGQFTLSYRVSLNDYELWQHDNGDAYLIAHERNVYTETYYTGGVSYICTEIDGINSYSTKPGFETTLKSDVYEAIRDIPVLERFSYYEMTSGASPKDWVKFHFYQSTIAFAEGSMTIRSDKGLIDVVAGNNSEFFENLNFDFNLYS